MAVSILYPHTPKKTFFLTVFWPNFNCKNRVSGQNGRLENVCQEISQILVKVSAQKLKRRQFSWRVWRFFFEAWIWHELFWKRTPRHLGCGVMLAGQKLFGKSCPEKSCPDKSCPEKKCSNTSCPEKNGSEKVVRTKSSSDKNCPEKSCSKKLFDGLSTIFDRLSVDFRQFSIVFR